jgi:hypothetical protein
MRLASCIASFTAATALAVGGLILAAPAAQATANACVEHLAAEGHSGPLMPATCDVGEISPEVCATGLTLEGVPTDIAREACEYAAQP